MLVTADGAPIPESRGTVRAGEALRFPTETVPASDLLPDLDKYQGPPIEYGRMEPTASDPNVEQQFGMIVGVPNAGQLNALGTLNIRVRALRHLPRVSTIAIHPKGPLPPDAPPICDEFRQQPDALEARRRVGRHLRHQP